MEYLTSIIFMLCIYFTINMIVNYTVSLKYKKSYDGYGAYICVFFWGILFYLLRYV